jgi:hypothetical protein
VCHKITQFLDDLMTINFKGNIVLSGWSFILFRLVTSVLVEKIV